MDTKFYILSLFFIFNSCTNNSNFGNDIYFQSEYESIDFGNNFGSCIFLGEKKDSYTTFHEILVYSDVLAIFKDGDYLYVKQKFNSSSFKKLMLQQYKFINKNNLIPTPYIPKEIYETIIKEKNMSFEEIIENSKFYKIRNINQSHNYYIISIKKRKVLNMYNLIDFKTFLKKNNKSYVLNKL